MNKELKEKIANIKTKAELLKFIKNNQELATNKEILSLYFDLCGAEELAGMICNKCHAIFDINNKKCPECNSGDIGIIIK